MTYFLKPDLRVGILQSVFQEYFAGIITDCILAELKLDKPFKTL